ncbi:MAG: ubiquinone/menaquinone biosynthesis methyltransferase [Ramlibacter sp.]|jgi:SAM-dependent methyltransferase|nr:ubiquinone/menaquinone biosynthesis methyltransferase [Ramlibacter sp.]MCE3273602.1 ubiquinone/menaquinone biosynthesis methyltransferase [Ramlibacter sp.]
MAASTDFTGPQFYDEFMGPVQFGPFAADLADRLPADLHGKVLEIACGTGLVTRELRRRLLPSVDIVATDLGAPMLDYAKQRVTAGGIAWQQADAQDLPFADGEFAAVVCGFGLMFPPDRAKAFAEARRVLARGGLLLFNVWDRIEENPHALANAQAVESRFPGDADMKFRTPYELHDPALLQSLLAQAGFADITMETRRIAIDGADPRKIAAGQIRGTPRAALLLQRGVPLDAVIDDVAAALARQGGDPYHGHAQALVVRAR